MRDRRNRAETLIRVEQDRIPHLFVGGLDIESESNATIPVINPANGQPIGRCPAANVRDVEKAVISAKKAFEDGWSESTPNERSDLLLHIADAIENEAEDLAILETLQTGKTFRDVLDHDIRPAVRVLRYFAGWTTKRPGEAHDLGRGVTGYLHWEQHAVIAAILPWSEPFAAAVRRIAPALALGSSIVLKPPEQAPLTIFRLSELMHEAGLPSGVCNVVTGHGSQAGEALASSHGVSVLSYGGSIEGARRVLLGAAKSNLKQVAFDLGGKSACILFEDADYRGGTHAAVESIFSSRCVHNMAAARLLVHESLYTEVATTVAARAKEIVLGDPLDEHTQLGPMISEEHMKRVLAYIELGRRERAKLVAGGQREVQGSRSEGFFVKPTVFVEVMPSMRVAKEEIAGPVLTIIPFRNEDEAIQIANDTEYGRSASLWTKDLSRAQRVARRLRAGVIWINHYDRHEPALPSGGTDLSGTGRDMGRLALDQYSRSKTVYVPSR